MVNISRVSVVAAILVFLVVSSGVGLLLFSRKSPWTATASVVVFPDKALAPGTAAGYYDTLSRGQITATFAQVVRLQRFKTAAAERAGLSAAERAGTKVTVEVVPDTALLTISASASSPKAAEKLADGTLAEASSYLATLSSPYTVSTVSNATGTAVRTIVPKVQTGAVVLFVAVVAGFVTGIAIEQIRGVLVRFRRIASEPEATYDLDEWIPQEPEPVSVAPATDLLQSTRESVERLKERLGPVPPDEQATPRPRAGARRASLFDAPRASGHPRPTGVPPAPAPVRSAYEEGRSEH